MVLAHRNGFTASGPYFETQEKRLKALLGAPSLETLLEEERSKMAADAVKRALAIKYDYQLKPEDIHALWENVPRRQPPKTAFLNEPFVLPDLDLAAQDLQAKDRNPGTR